MSEEIILSDQQKQIVELLNEGHTWKEAANELDISDSHLEEQMARVKAKQLRIPGEIAKLKQTWEFLEDHGR